MSPHVAGYLNEYERGFSDGVRFANWGAEPMRADEAPLYTGDDGKCPRCGGRLLPNRQYLWCHAPETLAAAPEDTNG